MNDKVLSLCGLARKAGKAILGSDMVTTAIRGNKKPSLVLLASDASQNTGKRISDACRFHHVTLINSDYSSDIIAKAVGAANSITCVAISDDGFAKSIITNLNKNSVADIENPQEVQ